MKLRNTLTKIYQDAEDGHLSLYHKDMTDKKQYINLTHQQFVEAVEARDMWDEIDPEVYASALADVGLSYAGFDDPDAMWDAYLAKLDGDDHEEA